MNTTIVAEVQHVEVLHFVLLDIQMNGEETILIELLFYNDIT
jgi:hypothetical protein